MTKKIFSENIQPKKNELNDRLNIQKNKKSPDFTYVGTGRGEVILFEGILATMSNFLVEPPVPSPIFPG